MPASTPPRSPARRGTQARRAPVAATARSSALYPPGVVASRSPTRTTAPGWRSASLASARTSVPLASSSVRTRSPAAMPSSHSASVPGAAGSSVPCMRCTPRDANGATENTRTRCRSAPLRRRRNATPASSLASRPTSRTAGAFSRSGKVTPRPVPATACARKSASSALCARARWSTSFVRSHVRASLAYAYASSTVSRPPGRTPTPPASRARVRASAATSSASAHEAGRSSPRVTVPSGATSRSRTSGCARRSGADCHVKAKRSRSVIHSSLTSGSWPARRRSTTPRRWSTRIADPDESCSATDGVETRSNGRDRKRYAAPVSAPTGQICTVLPEKYDANGRPASSSRARPTGRSPGASPAGGAKSSTASSKRPICCAAPRFCRSMNASPAISWEKRVHRWHGSQRSRSSRIVVETAIGLGNVRFTSTNRLVARPLLIAWFCRGHSPPLSHTGQSSGWLMSSSSMIPCCALSATGLVRWVFTTMPGVASSVHDACGFGIGRTLPSRSGAATSTRHWRHAPAGSSSGSSQNRGIWIPICSAARITSVPLGTDISMSSIVNVTWSAGAGGLAAPPEGATAEEPVPGAGVVVVISALLPSGRGPGGACGRRAPRPPGRTGSGAP